MKIEYEIEAGLLQAFIAEVKAQRLPVRIQRGVPFVDETGSELDPVVIEYPDTGFDFNAMMSEVINEHYNLKKHETTK